MSNYSKINFIYFLQKWMDSVAGQTFLNYAYSWGAAVVILGTLFKLTHLPGADTMLFIGMGTEVFVFFISAFDRPFDKTTIDMTLDNHMADNITVPSNEEGNATSAQQSVIIGGGTSSVSSNASDVQTIPSGANGGTVIIGGGVIGGGIVNGGDSTSFASGSNAAGSATGSNSTGFASSSNAAGNATGTAFNMQETEAESSSEAITFAPSEQRITTPAPAISQDTADAMEQVTTAYVERLQELNTTLEKVAALSSRLSTDSEEMENLNRTLTGIARVYEMQLKSASQQITTQDEINEQTRKMAQQIQELNSIYARMIEAMTVNMNPLAGK